MDLHNDNRARFGTLNSARYRSAAVSIADTGGGSLVDGGSGRGSLDRRKYAAAGVEAAMRSARKSKSNDFLDRLDGGTGRPTPIMQCKD